MDASHFARSQYLSVDKRNQFSDFKLPRWLVGYVLRQALF